MAGGYIRIGELGRRTGVSPELLRAWERRYGLFEPDRSPGRFRLYSDADVSRVEAMQAQIAEGLSAAEAARRVLGMSEPSRGSRRDVGPAIDEPRAELRAALEAFDDAAAHAAIDQLIASLSLESFLREVVLPLLQDIGERWERGEITIAQEHFASNLVRGRLTALARSWDRGTGPRALLACAEGELHDLPLLAFGLSLREQGWRINYLGADTPVASVVEAARALAPAAVVISGTTSGAFDESATRLREVTLHAPLWIAGAAASGRVARRAHAAHLAGDVVLAAETLAAGVE